jgi:hypothetical protein
VRPGENCGARGEPALLVLDADKCLRMEAFVVSGPENNSTVKSVCFVFLTGTVLPQICVVYIVNPLANLGQGNSY